jgi:hypothetical protein
MVDAGICSAILKVKTKRKGVEQLVSDTEYLTYAVNTLVGAANISFTAENQIPFRLSNIIFVFNNTYEKVVVESRRTISRSRTTAIAKMRWSEL